MPELVTVFAASSRQGQAAVHALLAAGRPVRAVVRDPEREDARRLAGAGAEVVAGSLDDTEAIATASRDAAGVFLALPGYVSPQMTPGVGPDDELHRGRAIIDAAVHAGVGHVVYSSGLGADRPELSALQRNKSQLEAYLRAAPVAGTILRPVGFMENYLGPFRGLRPDGVLASVAPPDVPEQLIAVADIGAFAALALTKPDEWAGRELAIAGDELTVPDIAAAIAAATGKTVRYERVLDAQRDPQIAKSLALMYSDERPVADLAACRAAHPGHLSFEAWLRQPENEKALTGYLTT
jgi:uncharacterized protein YbjT (DUF2867 family)